MSGHTGSKRSEAAIFKDLSALCKSPGYVHAVAYLCVRDNVLKQTGEELTAKDLAELSSDERLLRYELTVLIGLMIQGDVDFELPPQEVLGAYIESTDALMNELHQSISANAFAGALDAAQSLSGGQNPMSKGEVLREAIFYGAESAYPFQYREFAPKKYASDDAWLLANKGFTIEQAARVISAVGEALEENLNTWIHGLGSKDRSEWTVLPGLTVTAEQIAQLANFPLDVAKNVLDAFTLAADEKNRDFHSITDFNAVNATPLICNPSGGYVLFHYQGLLESFYESPFYWMIADEAYRNAAMENRGRFAEDFCFERLRWVFGRDRVYRNADLFDGKEKIGEVDVLVIFGNRAIVLQTKSKRLTLEARKGNDLKLQDDFKKGVQHAYEQGFLCASRLDDPVITLRPSGGGAVNLPHKLKRVYILCIVSDHYPALSFQAGQFLKYDATPTIRPPLVADVFLLDVLAEMLSSPLHMLSYIDRRANYTENVFASHELVILAYHLKKNLWVEGKGNMPTMMYLHDEISTELDLAMAVRRHYAKGSATPDGILTRFEHTAIGRVVEQIEGQADPGTIELGFLLLALSEDAVVGISKAIDHLAARARADGVGHDITTTCGAPEVEGLTIHVNDDPLSRAVPALRAHAEVRKYSVKARAWHGLCVSPYGLHVRFGVYLEHDWKHDPVLENATKGMAAPAKFDKVVEELGQPPGKRAARKVGRNAPCPCGSGVKYKKCHGRA